VISVGCIHSVEWPPAHKPWCIVSSTSNKCRLQYSCPSASSSDGAHSTWGGDSTTKDGERNGVHCFLSCCLRRLDLFYCSSLACNIQPESLYPASTLSYSSMCQISSIELNSKMNDCRMNCSRNKKQFSSLHLIIENANRILHLLSRGDVTSRPTWWWWQSIVISVQASTITYTVTSCN
jgi:hypothetical protein